MTEMDKEIDGWRGGETDRLKSVALLGDKERNQDTERQTGRERETD